jgi:hypothetical protein
LAAFYIKKDAENYGEKDEPLKTDQKSKDFREKRKNNMRLMI